MKKLPLWLPEVYALLCAAAYLLLTANAGASVGISGGPLYAIAVGTDSDETVYAATGSGMYTSSMGRDIWTPTNAGLTSSDVYAVVAPVTGTAVYCATGDGIFQHSSPESAWTSAGLQGSPVFSISVHPLTSTRLAAGTSDGVYTTVDAGTTWTKGAASPPFVYAFAISAAQPSTIHAASYTDGIYTSTDFGATWTKSASAPQKAYCIAVMPDAPGVLYAGTPTGLYKSTNSGASWIDVAAAFSSAAVYRVALDASAPASIYVATDTGIYRSIDDDRLWFAAYDGIATEAGQGPFVREIVIDPLHPQRLYAGTYSGQGTDARIYRSTNGGFTWTQINRTLATTTVSSLAIDPDDTETVYAGTTTLGVLKSTNGGLSWREANAGLLDVFVRAVAVSPARAPQSATLYAGTTVGLFRSRDSGQVWEQASPPYDIYRIGIAPDGVGTLYVGTNQGIFASDDEGETWRPLNNNLVNPCVSSFAFDPEDSATVYVGTRGAGIFKTLTGGQVWFEANTGIDSEDITALANSPLSDGALYAGTSARGVYKSIDDGWNWESAGPDGSSIAMNALAVNPAEPDIIYAATGGMGLYRSTDGGASWVPAGTEDVGATIYDAVVDPQTPQKVLLAVDGAVVQLVFNETPEAPSLPSPADGAVSQPLTATLSWNGADPDPGDRLSYAVYFGTDPAPDNNTPVLTTVPAYDPGPLQLGTTYYWCVTVTDAVGATVTGEVWRFSTLPSNPPLVPANPSPGDGAENQPCFLALSWAGGDPDEGDTVSYDIYFGTRNPPRLMRSNLPDAKHAVAFLRPLTVYYWQVVSRDAGGVEATGPLWSFSTGLLPQECLVEAVLGEDNPGLAEVRALRDGVLARCPAGRELIRLYYLLSPTLCRIARSNPDLHALTAQVCREALACLGSAGRDCSPEARERLLCNLRALLEAYAGEADSSTHALLRDGWKALGEFLERNRLVPGF